MTYTTTPVEEPVLDRAPAAQIEVDHVTKIYEPPATRRWPAQGALILGHEGRRRRHLQRRHG